MLGGNCREEDDLVYERLVLRVGRQERLQGAQERAEVTLWNRAFADEDEPKMILPTGQVLIGKEAEVGTVVSDDDSATGYRPRELIQISQPTRAKVMGANHTETTLSKAAADNRADLLVEEQPHGLGELEGRDRLHCLGFHGIRKGNPLLNFVGVSPGVP